MSAKNKGQSEELQNNQIYWYGNKFEYISQVGSGSFI